MMADRLLAQFPCNFLYISLSVIPSLLFVTPPPPVTGCDVGNGP